MLAGKGKPGEALVIEFNLAPTSVDMAIGTVFPQPPFVGIIFAVAILTAAGRFPVFFFRCMAGIAGSVYMCARQTEVGAPMVEGFFFQEDDVGCASLVFGMAACAVGAVYIRYAAVKTAHRPYILGHTLVAGGTELCLPCLLKRLMTFAARIFELGMTLDYRTGHDQPLQGLAGCRIRR